MWRQMLTNEDWARLAGETTASMEAVRESLVGELKKIEADIAKMDGMIEQSKKRTADLLAQQ